MLPLIVHGPARRLHLEGVLVGYLFVGFQRRLECRLGGVLEKCRFRCEKPRCSIDGGGQGRGHDVLGCYV
jgi:hypothetical protein